MTSYLGRRLLLSSLTLILITAAVYAAIRVLPGAPGPGEESTAPGAVDWRLELHLRESIPSGYARWISDVVRLDFGTSLVLAPGRPVAELVGRALPYTLLLGSLAFTLTWLAAIPLGILSAWKPASPGARISAGLLFVLHALPAFWIGLALQKTVAGRLGALPAVGAGPIETTAGPAGLIASAPYWILPTAAIALGSLAFVIRFCRDALLESVRQGYTATARSKGAGSSRVLWRHALAGSAVTLLSLTGLMLPGILSGSVVIETIFGLPGVGSLFYSAASRRDYPVIMTLSLLTAAATVAAHLATDLLSAAADPRIAWALDEEEARG